MLRNITQQRVEVTQKLHKIGLKEPSDPLLSEPIPVSVA